MYVALRFPSLSMRSGRMMGCGLKASGLKASGWGRWTNGRSRLLFTSPVRSHMARSRSLLSSSSFSHTVLILSLSRVIRPSSLLSFWTMSRTTPYCVSADESGEPSGDSGAGGEGSTGGVFGWKAISVSSSSPLQLGRFPVLLLVVPFEGFSLLQIS